MLLLVDTTAESETSVKFNPAIFTDFSVASLFAGWPYASDAAGESAKTAHRAVPADCRSSATFSSRRRGAQKWRSGRIRTGVSRCPCHQSAGCRRLRGLGRDLYAAQAVAARIGNVAQG